MVIAESLHFKLVAGKTDDLLVSYCSECGIAHEVHECRNIEDKAKGYTKVRLSPKCKHCLGDKEGFSYRGHSVLDSLRHPSSSTQPHHATIDPEVVPWQLGELEQLREEGYVCKRCDTYLQPHHEPPKEKGPTCCKSCHEQYLQAKFYPKRKNYA